MTRYIPIIRRWLCIAIGIAFGIWCAIQLAHAASVSVSVTGSNGVVSVDIEATEGATASGSASSTVNGVTTTIEHSCAGPCSFHERVEAARARAQAFRDRVAAERAARADAGKP